jgi:pseudouridine-5'-phosphate glycosidase
MSWLEQIKEIRESLARFHLSAGVARALVGHHPVVALESTVIAHGLPAPYNLETAIGCEAEVRAAGAEPATIGIIGGRPVIGLEHEQLEAIAARSEVAKVNAANLARIVATKQWGATTVAATLHLAALAGIKVFATGGIGGVHRGAGESFDISADLTALSQYPILTVCAGAKAILDLPKTLESLETLGIPVIGYQTDELPAFYSRQSGLSLDLRADSPEEVAALAVAHWQLGYRSSILVVVPVPAEAEIPSEEIASAIGQALAESVVQGVVGKKVTPFLLQRIAELTNDRSLTANIALLRQNAHVAGQIASALSRAESPANAGAEGQ